MSIENLKESVRLLHIMTADGSPYEVRRKARLECESQFIELFKPTGKVGASSQFCKDPLWIHGDDSEVCYYDRMSPEPVCLICGAPIIHKRLFQTGPE